ncbi:MAG: ribosome silencing factor [Legionellaceae bacterium]
MAYQNTNLQTLLQVLEDHHAHDITTLDVHEQTTITDYMIICAGRSSRQVRAIAEHVIADMKTSGYPSLGSSGLDSADWALVDFGDFVVHIMQPDARAFYNLEGLWHDHNNSPAQRT